MVLEARHEVVQPGWARAVLRVLAAFLRPSTWEAGRSIATHRERVRWWIGAWCRRDWHDTALRREVTEEVSDRRVTWLRAARRYWEVTVYS